MPECKSSPDYLRHGSSPTFTHLSLLPGHKLEVSPGNGNGPSSRNSGDTYNQTRIQDNACTPEHPLESTPPLFSAFDSSNFYTDLSFDQLDLEDTIAIANPFSIPIRRRESSPKYGLSPSSLLYKYSNLAGMPEMDTRTVLSSVHGKANTINSTTTATTHTCIKPSIIAMTEHSTIRSPGQGAECNLTSGFPIHDQTKQDTTFAANQGQPYNPPAMKPGFDSYFPTHADAIFHMHACDDPSVTDPVDNLTLFQPNDSGIQDMDTLDTAYPPSALRKVAENFQQDKDDLFLPVQNKVDESSLLARKKRTKGFQQPFGSSVDDIGSNYFDSFYDNHQFFPTSSSDVPGSVFCPLKRDYYSETDSALFDVFFQDDSELMYDDSSHSLGMKITMDTSASEDIDSPETFPGNKKDIGLALNQQVARPTKLQTAESTKVVAELLAGLLDDVDVPYYMNEIESGVTSTPDGKEVGFLGEPSSLSMSNSWMPSTEKNGLHAGRNPVAMEQGLEQSKRNQAAENRGMTYSPSSMDSNSIVSSTSSFSAHNASSESISQAPCLPAPPPPPPPPKLQKPARDATADPQAVQADAEQDIISQKLAKIM